MVLTYRKAAISDADLLIDIYNSAFYDDFVRYGECPGYGKSKNQMEQSILKFPKYIIIKDNIPVGVISLENRGNGHYHLGCLCIIPAYQGMGIGTLAFRYMLTICSDWRQIILETPSDKEQNRKFYTETCGFKIGGKGRDGDIEVTYFILERNLKS